MKLRRLQLHVRDGQLDAEDFLYAQSLDLYRRLPGEVDDFLAHRVLHVHFSNKSVVEGNVKHVKELSKEVNVPPSICIHKTRGGRCTNVEGEVNQLPAMSMYVPSLDVVCTANGLGYPQLTTTLNIANGTRGKVVANMYAPNTNTLTVTIVDFPSYTGSSLIGPGWPHSWVPVAPVTRVCDKGCCERTGFPLAPGSHVTLFKCQGLTCGHGKTNERLLLYCEDLVRAEKMWPRSFYVALTRTIDASDLAFVHTTGLKYELWETINRASYHQIRKEENKSNELTSKETCAEVAEHTTHTGWVKLLTTIDTLANDGLTDATCASNDRILCASQNCAACKLATESART